MLRFPGYNRDNPGTPARVELNVKIAELEAWTSHPDMRESPVFEPLQVYLSVREQAKVMAEQLGFYPESFASSKTMLPIRIELERVGAELVRQYPAFRALWEQVLRYELQEPDPQAASRLAEVPGLANSGLIGRAY